MNHQKTIAKKEEMPELVHRDLSWLSFNERVLQEAKDKRNPLLERVKFLGIYSKNLGEFFHVRMAYHLNLIRINKRTRKKLDYSPKKLVKEITRIVNEQQIEFTRIVHEEIRPELIKNNIYLNDLDTLSTKHKKFLLRYFNDNVRPYVDPLLMLGKSVNPFLKDGSLYLGVQLKSIDNTRENQLYGLVRIPSDILPRFVVLPSNNKKHHIIMLDDILRIGLTTLFPGYQILGSYSFKMTRDAELYIEKTITGSIQEAIKKSLSKRQIGIPARFVYDRNMPESLLEVLTDSFDLHKYDKIKEGRYQNYYDFLKFPSFDKLELLDIPFESINYHPLENHRNFWEKIRSSDHFIHPPYHCFDTVVQFFENASSDVRVTEIFITLYRVGSDSRILQALIMGAKRGKKITVFVEVQARFDERRNLEWGEKLEQAGVNVIYSIQGIKVHCKLGLVKRMENGKECLYSLLSTGNFHEGNSKVYSDMCLFTSTQTICNEIYSVFQYLNSEPEEMPVFNHCLVGQSNLNDGLKNLIDSEIENVKQGKKAHIILKLNGLEDPEMIKKLYEASDNNVQIDLIVRGICCIIPGLPTSKNIKVISILDRYLEHGRVYYFHAGGLKKVYLSSADWMTRNLRRRIEVAFPIYSENIKEQILKILDLQLKDNVKGRIIDKAQTNLYRTSEGMFIQSQNAIYNLLKRRQLRQEHVFSKQG